MSRRAGTAGVAALLGLALLLAAARPCAALPPQAAPSWREVASGGVTVRFTEGDSLRAVRLLERLLAQPRLPALPAGLPDRAIAYLAPDEPTFRALTGGRVPDWGAAVALPGSRTIVLPAYASARSSPGSEAGTMRHEWAHLGLHAWLDGLQVPRWFDEGYAMWAEGGFDASEAWRLRLLFALGRAPALDSLTLDWPRDGASAEVAYLLAASAVGYLVEESGERGIALLLGRWRESGSFQAALGSTYGVSPGQFEEDWRGWAKRRFGWLTVVSHSLALWTLFGLVLVLASWRRRARGRERMARLRATEPAEEPAYWMEEE